VLTVVINDVATYKSPSPVAGEAAVGKRKQTAKVSFYSIEVSVEAYDRLAIPGPSQTPLRRPIRTTTEKRMIPRRPVPPLLIPAPTPSRRSYDANQSSDKDRPGNTRESHQSISSHLPPVRYRHLVRAASSCRKQGCLSWRSWPSWSSRSLGINWIMRG
jgi:hypothetical protein